MALPGQGTVALELFEQAGKLDVLVAPLGGGGLLSGSAVVARGLGYDTEIWGVEPEAGDDFAQSLQAGRPVEIAVPKTIADGLQTQRPGDVTFAVLTEAGARVATVSDAELRDAVRFAFERLKLVIEPSGAAGIAALLSGKVLVRGQSVGVIVSGGNVDAATYREVLA